MTNFSRKPSPAFRAALEALSRLSIEERHEAFAQAQADDLKAVHASHLGKATKGKGQWKRLIGGKPNPDQTDQLPADDHTELWNKDGTVSYVSHPYDLRLDDLRAIVEACDEHGLTCHVDARSWYYPGGTIRLLWELAKAT